MIECRDIILNYQDLVYNFLKIKNLGLKKSFVTSLPLSTEILLFMKRRKFILKLVGDKLRDYLGQLSCKIIKTVLSLSTRPGEPV